MPKHESWPNMVAVELAVLFDRCLDQRLGNVQAVASQIAAWEHSSNDAHATIVTRKTYNMWFERTFPHYCKTCGGLGWLLVNDIYGPCPDCLGRMVCPLCQGHIGENGRCENNCPVGLDYLEEEDCFLNVPWEDMYGVEPVHVVTVQGDERDPDELESEDEDIPFADLDDGPYPEEYPLADLYEGTSEWPAEEMYVDM